MSTLTAPSKTTTLRVPSELRDEMARIAERRGSSMIDVVTDAVHRLDRDEWWQSVHDSLDVMTSREASSYQAEYQILDRSGTDGLGES